ncbi:hypothetical protein ABT300_05325, partial [Streptomyces sp. NPDC001027]
PAPRSAQPPAEPAPGDAAPLAPDTAPPPAEPTPSAPQFRPKIVQADCCDPTDDPGASDGSGASEAADGSDAVDGSDGVKGSEAADGSDVPGAPGASGAAGDPGGRPVPAARLRALPVHPGAHRSPGAAVAVAVVTKVVGR